MSVLKSRRHESKGEYVNIADNIYVETMNLLSRLSNRYQRIFVDDTMKLASEVLDNTEKAQSIRVTDEDTFRQRKAHLVEARASLMALDVHLTHIWRILMKNPQGCFTSSRGEALSPSESIVRLNKWADELGNNIDKEKNLITKLMQSDKCRYKSIVK